MTHTTEVPSWVVGGLILLVGGLSSASFAQNEAGLGLSKVIFSTLRLRPGVQTTVNGIVASDSVHKDRVKGWFIAS